jgi:DNA-binding NtrC family response regulator
VLTPAAEAALRAYAWPGNVRELRNVLERSVLLGDGRVLDASDLVGLAHELPSAASRPAVAGAADASAPAAALPFVLPEGGVDLEAVEREFLRQALERSAGSRTRAAALLGVSRHALRYRLEKFGLE